MISLARVNFIDLRVKAASVVLFGTISLWSFAPKAVFAQALVQHDQQALTILTQTIAASGGPELLTSTQDLTETGTVTYSLADPVTGNVTVKSRGLHQFKIEADLPQGKRTTVINGEGGSLTEADGRYWPIYRQSAAALGSMTLPQLLLLGALGDSSTSIIYGGLVTHNGISEYDIRLQKVYTQKQDPTQKRGALEARDFYIDPKTLLVSSIADQIHFKVFNDEGIPHEILYSNYQTEDGIVAPLTVVETVRGVAGSTLALSQIAVNSGLGDADFAW
jgi:hypothetical protein